MFPVYFARERTQFLMDHLKDLILSSVIPMVAPTWCHKAMRHPCLGRMRTALTPEVTLSSNSSNIVQQ